MLAAVRSPGLRKPLLWGLVAASGSLAAAVIGLRLQRDGIAVFWPAIGVAAGLMLVTEGASRRAVAVGVLVALAIGNALEGRSLATSAVFMAGNIGQAVLLTALLEGVLGRPFRLDRLASVTGFLAGAAIVPAAVGLLTSSGLRAAGHAQGAFGEVWWLWFTSHTVGILCIAPAVLLLGTPLSRLARGQVEDIALSALIATAAVVAIGLVMPEASLVMLLVAALLVPLIWWIVPRASVARAAVALLVVAAVTIASSGESGAFAGSILAAQAFLAVMAVALRTLGAVREGRPAGTVSAPLQDQRALVVLVPLVLFAGMAWWTWWKVEEQASVRVGRMADVVAEHAHRVLEVQEGVLGAALAHVRGRSPAQIRADESVHAFLAELDRASKAADGLVLRSIETGEVIADSGRFPAGPAGAQDPASAARGSAMLIGETSLAEGSGGAAFAVSRADPAGRLVAVSRLPLTLFQDFYAGLVEGGKDSVGLVRDDGALLVRFPALPSPVGLRVRQSELDRTLNAGSQEPTIWRSPFDGELRLKATRAVAGYPVHVAYGIGTGSLRAAWLNALVPFGMLALVAAGALSALTWRLQRRAAEVEAARLERQSRRSIAALSERLGIALDAANAGAWEWSIGSERASWSPESFALFGLEASDGVPAFRDWIERCVHRDDRASLERSLEDARTGRRGEFSFDFRIRHPARGTRWINSRGRIERDAAGSARRLVGLNIDVTAQREAAERLKRSESLRAYLLDLGDTLRELRDSAAIIDAASERLARRIGAGQVAYAEIDLVRDEAVIERDWNDGTIPSNAGRHRLPDFGKPFIDDLKQGEIIAIADVKTDSRTSSPQALATFEAVSIRAFLNVPLVKEGRLVAVLAAHHRDARPWSEDEVRSAEETAERTWATLERARAEAELREREARFDALFSSIDEGFCLCEVITDAVGRAVDYRFLEVNPLFERMTGLAGAAGRTALELVPGLERRWIEQYARVGLGGETLRFEDSSSAMGRHFDVFSTPVGPRGRFAVVFKDVTESKRSEQALRDAARTIRLASEAARLGAWRVDERTKRLDASDELLKLFGIERAGWDGSLSALEAVMHPDDVERRQREHDEAVERGGTIEHEFRILAPGGEVRWVHSRGLLVQNASGEAIESYGIAIDVTERKRIEEALRESKDRYQSIFDSVGVSIWEEDFSGVLEALDHMRDSGIVDLRAHLAAEPGLAGELLERVRLTDVNAFTLPLYGVSSKDELLGSLAPYFEHEERAYFVEELVALWEGRRHRTGERRVRTPAGRSIDVMFTIVYGGRRAERTIVSLLDLTERKRAEQRLAENEERFRLATHAARTLVYDVDLTKGGAAVAHGLERVVGVADEPGLLTSSWWHARINPEDLPAHLAVLERHLREGGRYVSGYRARHADGRWIWIHDSGEVMLDGEGRAVRIVGTISDVTEQKRAEEKIRLLMREVNHRSKNLLSLVQAVARQTAATDKGDFLQRFDERLHALSAGLDLLVKSEWKGVELDALVRAQLAHFADLIDRRISLEGPAVQISAAAAQTLGMALHELATNAGKHGALSTDRGRVAIAWSVAKADGGASRFEITWIERDGPPVAAPQRRGFGTTVTVNMARLGLGADVKLEHAPGGVVWRLSCPVENVLEAPSLSSAKAERSGAGDAQTARGRVLVVEDEALLSVEIAEILAGAGFEVLGPAASVARALDLLGRSGCDAAVLDVNLGRETSESVAVELLSRGTPFITISGYAREQQPIIFRGSPLLAKPVRSGVLLAEVKRCLAGSRATGRSPN